MSTIDDLIPLEEAAKILGVKVKTLHNWRSIGKYSECFVKIGRVQMLRDKLNGIINDQTGDNKKPR